MVWVLDQLINDGKEPNEALHICLNTLRLDKKHGKSFFLSSLLRSEDLRNPNGPIHTQIQNLKASLLIQAPLSFLSTGRQKAQVPMTYCTYFTSDFLLRQENRPVWVSMQRPGNQPYFFPWGGQDTGVQSERSAVLGYFLLLVIGMEILSWMYVEREWKALLHMYISHIPICTFLWWASCQSCGLATFNIDGALYFPKMSTTISPISQGSFRTLAFIHQEVESMSPPLESG